MSARYVPGAAAVLVGPRGLVATRRDHAADLVALAGTDPVVLTVIDTLSGGSLANLPDFACVVTDGDDLRVVVRGDFAASAGGQRWTGEGVATWREHIVPGGAAAEVTVEAIGGDTGPELPLSTGIVLASRLTWTRDASGAAEAPREGARHATDDAPTPPAAPREPVTPVPSLDPEATYGEAEFDAMFGATVVGRPQDEAPEPAESAAEPADALGDHDGRTITAAQLRAMREQAAAGAPRAGIVLPSGARYDVAPRILIGRRPQARQVATSEVPTLVTVDDPYVSGTHLEIVLQGDQLLVTDLSTNGTLVTRPGERPEQLAKSVPTAVTDGTRLSLSEDLTVTVELQVGG